MNAAVVDFRPLPPSAVPDQHSMLKKGLNVDLRDLVGANDPQVQKKLDEMADKLGDALANVLKSRLGNGASRPPETPQGTSSAPVSTEDLLDALSATADVIVDGLLESDVPGGPLSAPSVFDKAVRRAADELASSSDPRAKEVSRVLRDLGDRVAQALSKRSGDISSAVIRNANIPDMPDDQFRKLMDDIVKADLKPHGAGFGAGAGVLSELYRKVLMDPRSRTYLRERLRSLRTAAYYRQMTWPRGRRIAPRETFRKYARTGIPFPPVYKTKLIRPRTREDIVFFVDVSGSMGPVYPAVYTVMKTLEDLGLNVRMYAGDTVVEYVTDVDKVLSRVGGGGTAIGAGVNTIISELGSTLRDTTFIVYTDLEFTDKDFDDFKVGLDRLRGMGSHPVVWVYDCGSVQSEVDELEKSGFKVYCDVRSIGDMVQKLNAMRKMIIK